VSREIPGPPPLPLLDAEPGEPIAPARGGRRVLGRDPFEEPDAPDPGLARLAPAPPTARAEPRPGWRALEVRPAPSPPRRRARRSEPEGDAAPPPRPLELRDAERRLAALERLVPEGQRHDAFGLSPDVVRRALPFFELLYRRWFRVRSEGHEHVPADGPAILVANHGGLLPFDGAMCVLDVFLHTDPPRLPRTLVDRFAGSLPFVNVFFARAGQVVGTRENFRELLRRGELVLVFPEGMAGIRKTVAQRYRLQPFHAGFAEEALRARVPIVPVTIVGAEDQAPILYDVRPLARRLGLPVAPITPTFPWLGPLGLLPYPVPYRILYGEPLRPPEPPEAAEDAPLVQSIASEVRRVIQRSLDRLRG
jgi:1-acyl-sn-glycerol-3-phosphate acyltransferase